MIVTRTPYRVSFAGGGSDMPAWYERGEIGSVLSAAIDRYVYVIVGRNFDPDRIRVAYSVTENVNGLGELRHELIREALRAVGMRNGVEIATIGQVPGQGTGLGSSASVTVGALHALSRLVGDTPKPEWLAETASDIEMGALRRPAGKQDQYAAAFGGINHMVFHPSGRVDVHPLKLASTTIRTLSKRLMLFYTGIHRRSTAVLSDTRDRLRSKARTAEQMRQMIGIVSQCREALELDRLDDFGELLNENWIRKRRLSGMISTADIDGWYETAMLAGALGGKLCGAGAGGFLLFYVPQERQAAVRRALPLKCLQVEYGAGGSECVFDG